jgi:protein TonB
VTSTPLPPPSPQIKEKLEAADHSPAATATDSSSHKNTSATLDDSEPEVVVKNIEPEPRVVKANPARPNGTAKKKDAEVEAPSVLGSATADASSLPTIVTSAPVAVPSAAAPEMLRVSQGVTQGLLIRRVQPVYPQSAMQMRIAGTVQLLAVISKTGDVANVKILTGEPVLARAAVDAVRQWKYKPYLLDGEPVEIQTQVTINFKLP